MHRYLILILLGAAPWTLRAGDAADAADAQRGPLRLSLKRAVDLALSPEGNTYMQLSDESFKQAKSRSAEARSALLPDIEAQAGRVTAMRSLAALGLNLAASQALLGAASNPPPCTSSALICGVLSTAEAPLLEDIANQIPRVIGPFNSVDVRARLTQNIFDFSSIRRYQASRAVVRAAKAERDNTGDTVTAAVAKAYLNALRTDAALQAAQANVDLAEAVVKQAENQKRAGNATGMDVTRAEVQLANDKQRLLAARNEQTKAHLQLLRAIGLSLETTVELTDKLTYEPMQPITVEQARAEAFKNRPDLKAQAQREAAARLNAHAVKYERLPTFGVFADYGTTGVDGLNTSLLPTRDYGFALRVPIFDGGRRDARRAEAASQFRQERTRTNDLHEQVELEIRTSLDSLHSAEEQYQVAQDGLRLAENELTQARRRYAAGVASSLEVTDSQTRMERARDNQITALFAYNAARIDLGKAMGNLQSMIQ
jgi:outer membrane protein